MAKKTFTFFIPLPKSLFGHTVVGRTGRFTVSGKVTSFEESFPLEGVSVHAKGTTVYDVTKADGTYKIEVRPEHNTLLFELTDYELSEVSLSEENCYDVVLKKTAIYPSRVVLGSTRYIHQLRIRPFPVLTG